MFLRSHLLDLDQPKTLRGFSDLLIFFDFFFWNLLLVFRDSHPFIFGPDIVFINVLYYNWGTVALICIRAVLLILNININIKNKLIYSCCVDHDFINVFPHDWPSEQCCK